jgi:hypothetical protein
LRERLFGALHWQTNHVRHRPVDRYNNTSTRTLRAISAGLIDWIHQLEILGDSALSKLAKTDLRNFGETNSSSRMDDANRRADVVRSSTQSPKNHSRMI